VADPRGQRRASGALEPWLSYAGTPIEYTPAPDDFEVNGIVASDHGRYLVVVQANTGKLFRIEIATKEVVEIDHGGASANGDGLQLLGRRLYAVAGGAIVEVLLSGDLTHGEVVSRTTDPSFSTPTTNAIARGRMLVVNSQFDRLFSGQSPVLPFTVSSIPLPSARRRAGWPAAARPAASARAPPTGVPPLAARRLSTSPARS
jgi:hypothetical protein